MFGVVFALALCGPLQLELAGVASVPHVRAEGIRSRRTEPEPASGALVRLFLRNSGDGPLSLSEGRFDRQSPLSLVPAGAWAWADVPSVWTGEATTLPPEGLCVWTYNGLGPRWTEKRAYRLTVEHEQPPGPPFELVVRPGTSQVRLESVAFLGDGASVYPTRVMAHVVNGTGAPVELKEVRLYLPETGGDRRVLLPREPSMEITRYPADGLVPPGETGILDVRMAEPLPLTHGAVEVKVAEAGGGVSSLWAHFRIRRETFDISGGWVDGEAADGSRMLSKEAFLKTLARLHVDTAHRADVSGYTDQTGPDGLFTRYPLKAFNALVPLDAWDTDARLPLIHAAEYLGEPQYGGFGRVAMQPQEVFARLARYGPSRIASTVTLSDPLGWERYAGLSDYPHFDAYRVSCPAPDTFRLYDRWGSEKKIGWGAPLETIGTMTRALRDVSRPGPIAVWSQGRIRGGMCMTDGGGPRPRRMSCGCRRIMPCRQGSRRCTGSI